MKYPDCKHNAVHYVKMPAGIPDHEYCKLCHIFLKVKVDETPSIYQIWDHRKNETIKTFTTNLPDKMVEHLMQQSRAKTTGSVASDNAVHEFFCLLVKHDPKSQDVEIKRIVV